MDNQSEINRIKANIAAAYTAVSEKGGTLPSARNSNNLSEAILTISSNHNLLKQEVDGTEHWISQTEIAAGYLEQRFNE